jgi:hypothetical protein
MLRRDRREHGSSDSPLDATSGARLVSLVTFEADDPEEKPIENRAINESERSSAGPICSSPRRTASGG